MLRVRPYELSVCLLESCTHILLFAQLCCSPCCSAQEVQVRMGEVEQLYTEVIEVAVLRQQWLHDALAVYRMFSEVNACELWIDEKEQWLDKMQIPERLEDVEVVAHR